MTEAHNDTVQSPTPDNNIVLPNAGWKQQLQARVAVYPRVAHFARTKSGFRAQECFHPCIHRCCAQRCQCVLSQSIAQPHRRSAAVNRPTFARRWQWEPDPTNPTLLRTCHFLRFWCETELSLQYSLVHIFADLIFQKRPAHLYFLYFDNFQVQIKLPVQSCALLSITFADRAPNPRKQRPFLEGTPSLLQWSPMCASCNSAAFSSETLVTMEATLPDNYPKNTGFRAGECFHPRIHARPNSCCTSQLVYVMDGWHDDVVDMMMEKLTMTIACNSKIAN